VRNLLTGGIVLWLLWSGSRAGAQEAAPAQPEEASRLWGLLLKADFVERETVVSTQDYLQLVVGREKGRWINPELGLEEDVSQGDYYRSYFLSETIRFSPHQSVTGRLNHFEYPEWEIGANVLNLYYQGESKHWQGAVGLAYLAVIYDPDFYNQPWYFESQAPELRLLYLLAFRQEFLNQRLGFRAGLTDFTEFENYGEENLGPFIEPYVKLSDRVKLSLFYEWRYSGLIYQLPYHNRTTIIVGAEVRP